MKIKKKLLSAVLAITLVASFSISANAIGYESIQQIKG